MTVKEFLQKYDENYEFSEKELRDIFNLDLIEEEDDIIECVEEEYDENRRWTRFHTQWVKINNRYFEVLCDEGLTEYQDNFYGYQPREVRLEVVTRTITITENKWLPAE